MPGKNEPHIRGVGIHINKNIKDALLEWKPVSELIITAPINTKFRKMSVVQCYASTGNANLEKKEAFYSCLDRTLLDIHRSDIILLMGDFNAQVGTDNQDTDDVVGKHGLPHKNENGDHLIEPCGRHGLIIGSTIFSIRTVIRLHGFCLLLKIKWKIKSPLDVRNKRGADTGSDNHLLMGTIRCFKKKNKKKHT
jgi:hypothetical protein